LRREQSNFPHEIGVAERLIHDDSLSMARGEIVAPIGCHEQEGDVATRQYVGDIVDAAAVKIDVKKGAVKRFGAGQQPGFVQRPDRSDHFKAFVVQKVFDMRGHEEFVFYYQEL
jgi:hypothetical protein